MDREVREQLKVGDKVVIQDEGTLGWLVGSDCMMGFANKEVTIKEIYGNDYKIKEDSHGYYWSSSMFKNIINGVDYDNAEPQKSNKFVYKIEFDSIHHQSDIMSYYRLAKITSDLDELMKYNSKRFSKVVCGKWVVISLYSGRIYSEYNPHLMMAENRVNNYKLDNHKNLIVDSIELFENDDVYKVLTINFKTGKITKHRTKGNVCACCGRPLSPHRSVGLICYDCITQRKNLTYRFSYHDYCDGYPTPSKVDTTKVPVFGCEIERDYEQPDDNDYYGYGDDDEDDDCRDEDDIFDENLSSAMFETVKIMQEDQFKKGILKRENVFMCDGSLNNDGLEWITFPHTFEWYVKNKDKFDKALENLELYGFKNTSQAGNHIHMNRDFFTVNGKDYSDFCASKIAILFSKYWESFRAIAKRYDTDYTNKPACKHDDCPADIMYEIMENKDEHSVAVNLQHSKTVEIRLWSGIDNADDLLFYLDNMQALARYVKRVSLERIQTAKITDFMKYYKLDTSARKALNRMKCWRYSTVEQDALKDLEKFVEEKENRE